MGIYKTLRAWTINAANTLVYVGSGGTSTLHEGRYRLGEWTNWNRETSARPRLYATPSTEEELCAVIRDAKRLRVVGAGHTFGDQAVSTDVMVSLERYNRLISVDEVRRTLRVQAGMRLRELQQILYEHGFALPAAGSTDAQTLGGLIANDVHGSGSAFVAAKNRSKPRSANGSTSAGPSLRCSAMSTRYEAPTTRRAACCWRSRVAIAIESPAPWPSKGLTPRWAANRHANARRPSSAEHAPSLTSWATSTRWRW